MHKLCYNTSGDNMKKGILVTIVAVLMLTLVGCSKDKLTLYRETTFDVGFNTPFSLMLYTETQEEFDEYFEQMKTQVRRYNELFDIYTDYAGVNNIKTINDKAGIEPVEVDPILIELLDDAKAWTEKTNSLFDPTLGPVLKIWHEAREEGMELNRNGKFGPSPKREDLEAANAYVGWEFVEIDHEKNTVYLNDKNAALDVGAIAKGWAVEKVALSLEEDGIEYGIVNGGGNVRLIGSKYNEGSWSVGITNPDSMEDSSILSLEYAENMAVVTSGDYERFFIDDKGQQQHHIIDPKTLEPSRYSRSVTITTPDSGLADILATPFSLLNLEESEQYEKELNIDNLGLVFVKDHKDDSNHQYNYLEVDGKHIYYNDEIKDHIKK